MRARVVAVRCRVSAVALLAMTLSVGITVAGCTTGPSLRPEVVARDGAGNPPASAAGPSPQRPLPGLERPELDRVPWTNCTEQTRNRLGRLGADAPAGGNFSCADLLTTESSPNPYAETRTRMSILRAGDGPTPLVMLNDVDGIPGTLYAARLANRLPKGFLDTFSLIGVDRRGTGTSDGVHCIPTDVRQTLYGFDPANEDIKQLIQAGSTATQQCQIALDNRLQLYNTNNTIDDLEVVRQALGAQRLNALGRGEGSRVLAIYAQRKPERVGRFVLDGLPDGNVDAQARAESRAMSAEATFTAFAQQCAAGAFAGRCPLGDDPRRTVSTLLDRLTGTPLSTSDGIQLTAGATVNALLDGLADPDSWPRLAGALRAAGSGDAEPMATFVRPVLLDSPYEAPRLDPGLITRCNDEEERLPPERVAIAYKQLSGAYPLFGRHFAQDLALCLPWPVPSAPLPRPTATGAPPMLVLSTKDDPVTPGDGTERAAQQLVTARQVHWQGAGHGAVPASECTMGTVTRFLVRGQVPASTTTCPA